jgi:tetratricopeptide (TPR) repeat protein
MATMTAVTEQANQLHQQGREAASSGDLVRALELFDRARELEPAWAYPPYDIAFTYLLNDDLDEAERWYTVVDKLEPRGFFTTKMFLDIIQREKRGEVWEGFTKAYAMLEWQAEDTKRAVLQQIVERFPSFAPAWKDLAGLIKDDHGRLAALEHGLAGKPDDETYGMLILNKALVLDRLGRHSEGARLLNDLLDDKRCTQAVEALAKLTLSGFSSDSRMPS